MHEQYCLSFVEWLIYCCCFISTVTGAFSHIVSCQKKKKKKEDENSSLLCILLGNANSSLRQDS